MAAPYNRNATPAANHTPTGEPLAKKLRTNPAARLTRIPRKQRPGAQLRLAAAKRPPEVIDISSGSPDGLKPPTYRPNIQSQRPSGGLFPTDSHQDDIIVVSCKDQNASRAKPKSYGVGNYFAELRTKSSY
ncbi:hypothetical protein BCR34DRAFT_583529 [Clohesyomyces aquaticus]|uniref:Uncharacterized protein n=1 Tax=Clohesyomyces aquaticus TaxID=1231657 RepID=A0A1Y2A590_9PLEO|nr:hypothetical protein BCR34DRAFT_583529 [Clohesyomyces aquaticus]